jgi:hypothetical protein
MIWTAWSNGKGSASGSGYGLKMTPTDRDATFDQSWKTVTIQLPRSDGHLSAIVPISDAFWRVCSELRSQDIGRWLIANGHAPWPKGAPPKFVVDKIQERGFALRNKAK